MNKPDTGQPSTPYEKFLALARKVVRTPKAKVDKREREWKRKTEATAPARLSIS